MADKPSQAKYELVDVNRTPADIKRENKGAGRSKSADTQALEAVLAEFANSKRTLSGIPFDGDPAKFKTKVYNILRNMQQEKTISKPVFVGLSALEPGKLLLSTESLSTRGPKATGKPRGRKPKTS